MKFLPASIPGVVIVEPDVHEDSRGFFLETYHAEHQRICLDPNARNTRHTYVVPAEDRKTWKVQQMLVDPEENNDWVAEFEVDLAESRKAGEPVLKLRRMGTLV